MKVTQLSLHVSEGKGCHMHKKLLHQLLQHFRARDLPLDPYSGESEQDPLSPAAAMISNFILRKFFNLCSGEQKVVAQAAVYHSMRRAMASFVRGAAHSASQKAQKDGRRTLVSADFPKGWNLDM